MTARMISNSAGPRSGMCGSFPRDETSDSVGHRRSDGMVAQVFLPGAKPDVARAARSGAVAGAVGEQAEHVTDLEIVRTHRGVACVATRCRPGTPQQPGSDPSLVL